MSGVTEKQETSDVRTQILDAATRQFARRGFDGTSIRAISEEVGIAKPSLLYHFPSKDDLRRGVLEQVFSHWNEVLPELLRVATSGTSRFDSLITEAVGFFTADPNRARLLMREILDRPDQMKRQLREFLDPWMRLLADYIRRGREEGIIHEDVDPEAYILQVIQLVVGGLSQTDVFGGVLDESTEGEPSPAQQRQIDEIIRMARSALFVDADTTQ